MDLEGTKLRPGMRLSSAVSDAEVIVVRAPSDAVDLRCGGVPMIDPSAEKPNPSAPVNDGETLIGKRYEDPESGLLVLCTRAGRGSLALGERPLGIQQTRALPSSD